MQIKTTRHYLDCICSILLPYLPLLQQSLLKNVAAHQKISAEYLEARVISCVLKELERTLKKKQLNTTGINVTLKLTDATGVVLYKTLLDMPVPEQELYLHLVRQAWLEQLNQQIIY